MFLLFQNRRNEASELYFKVSKHGWRIQYVACAQNTLHVNTINRLCFWRQQASYKAAPNLLRTEIRVLRLKLVKISTLLYTLTPSRFRLMPTAARNSRGQYPPLPLTVIEPNQNFCSSKIFEFTRIMVQPTPCHIRDPLWKHLPYLYM